MSEPVQIAPMIAVYEDEGEFTLRMSDSSLAKSIGPQVIKAIGEASGARKLTLVTPNDTKVFRFGENKPVAPPKIQAIPSPVAPPEVFHDASAPPSPEMAAYDQEMQEAARLQREIDRENQTPLPEEPDAPSADTPRTRKRSPRPQSIPTACGRCQGTGAIASGGSCPVCQGKGSIPHYGGNKR